MANAISQVPWVLWTRGPRVAIVTTKPDRITPFAKGRHRERTTGSGEIDTSARVVKAAIECIVELGFYRGSSTNVIARRAGVTWGVIQWYFGNREGLMLAVLEDGASHLVETVENARIDGTTVAERMSQLIDVFSAHYARPDYLASLQVLLNMDHDPRTSSEVRKTMLAVAERADAHVRRLLREALGPAANKPDLSTAIFVVIRGFAFSQQLLDSMAYDTLAPKRDRAQRHRRLLAEMLAPYVEMAAKAER
jgi:AcrR family transcriptional regulator